MAPKDQYKTAFTYRYGTFQFHVVTFGLVNAPSTFQRAMHRVLFPLVDKGLVVYVDDVLVYFKDVYLHKKLLDEVFTLLQKYRSASSLDKGNFFLNPWNFWAIQLIKMASTYKLVIFRLLLIGPFQKI